MRIIKHKFLNWSFLSILSTCYMTVEAQHRFSCTIKTQDSILVESIEIVNSQLNPEKRLMVLDFSVDKHNNYFVEGDISGLSEYMYLNTKDTAFRLVVDTGFNEIRMFQSPITNRKNWEIVSGPVRLNNLKVRLDSIDNYYLKNYGDSVVNLNNNSIIFVLNSKKWIEESQYAKLEFLSHHESSYLSLLEMLSIYSRSPNMTMLELMYKEIIGFPPGLKSTKLGRELISSIGSKLERIRAMKIGNPVPVFTVKTDRGDHFSNESLKGDLYIVAFSATWCIPCQEYQSHLKQLYNEYHKQGLRVVYFNLDDDIKIWKHHIEKTDWIG